MASLPDDPSQLDTDFVARLEAFAAGRKEGEKALPWASRLSPRDRLRLREDLAVVLSEPQLTGEPLDGSEILNILEEWSAVAGWEGPLAEAGERPRSGAFSIDLRPREAQALAGAPPAVQRAARLMLEEFLTTHPTAGRQLTRGQIKKMKNREIWQIDLPDGYRLRYYVDKPKQIVYVVYLGPHPDGEARGREQSVRSRVGNERRWGE